jgi:aryl-alcohol dehydrogenase-like predicted oxidoreductase
MSMEYVKLGATGLEVSRLCFGGMSLGAAGAGPNAWTLDLEAARPILRGALEAGVTFFDTANMYSGGTSEEILGRVIGESASRDQVVLATKVFHRMHPGPNGAGLSRKAVMAQADASLRRLATDYIDLYQIHRWDDDTPIEETMGALHDLVKAGKVRYIGASAMSAWQFAKANHVAERRGWTRFVSMQDQYNLLYREEEREMLPLCADAGIGVVPFSPLARGRLARAEGASTPRTQTGRTPRVPCPDNDAEIIGRVSQLAERRGLTRAAVALAWLLHKPVVTAPIVGVTRPAHLDDALAALPVELSQEEIAWLEEAYQPHPPMDLQGRRRGNASLNRAQRCPSALLTHQRAGFYRYFQVS